MQVRPLRVILFACVLGCVGGVALSFHRQAQRERELERLADIAEKIGAAPEPTGPQVQWVEPPGHNLQLGPVHLAATRGLPPYPNAFVRPMLTSSGDGGVPLDIAWFGTKDSVRDVLEFYNRKLAEAGRIAVTHQYSDSAGYSGWLELSENRMHLIAVMRDRNQTLVFASSSLPEQLLQGGGAKLPDALPNVAGAEGDLAFDLGAQAGPMRHLWLKRYPQRSISSLVDEYRDGLESKGWQIESAEAQGPAAGRVLAKRADGASVRVTLQRDASATVAVYVSVTGA